MSLDAQGTPFVNEEKARKPKNFGKCQRSYNACRGLLVERALVKLIPFKYLFRFIDPEGNNQTANDVGLCTLIWLLHYNSLAYTE